MRKTALTIAIAVAGIVPLIGATDPPQITDRPQSVSYADLGTVVKVIGPLEEPLGKVLVIEGKLVPESEKKDYWSANIAENLVAVEKIDGKPLPKPRRVQVRLPGGHPPLTDKSETFTGYQDGGFVNAPPEVEAMRPPGTLPMQSNGWHFEVTFFCIDAPAKK